jgi:hypothetical protein
MPEPLAGVPDNRPKIRHRGPFSGVAGESRKIPHPNCGNSLNTRREKISRMCL